MDPIKRWYRSIPIWLALFLFVIAALLIASFFSNNTTAVINKLNMNIQAKYITVVEGHVPNGGDVTYIGGDIGEDVQYNFNYDQYSDKDRHLHKTYNFILEFAHIFYYSSFIILAVLLFYFTKLKKPLTVLMTASDKIADNELKFTVDYAGTDEMAKLCAAFEKMRSSLDENNRRMLHMSDQRKQLNDAYTHDLRTPIAVLKGYTDMLKKYGPTGELSDDEIIETVNTMSNHVSRLEQFVESMNTIQKLDDIMIQKTEVDVTELVGHLRETADILCKSSGLVSRFSAEICKESLLLDAGAVIQVYENLMSNAIRFSRTTVNVHCGYTKNFLILSISDDGKGFGERELFKACQPYYSGETQKQNYHFGLGLHICRTLCEKHGGHLQLENVPQGGAKITAYFDTTR